MIVIILFQLITCFSGGSSSDPCLNRTNYDKYWNEVAIHPYNILTTDRCSCRSQCEEERSCNAYSFDGNTDTCSLSTCDTYDSYLGCGSCVFYRKITRTSQSLCEPAKTMSYNTTLQSNSTTIIHLTIQQTTPVETTMEQNTNLKKQTTMKQTTTLEQQTTVEQTNTEKQSTTMEKTTSVNQYTTEKKRTTIGHSTTVKLSMSKEQRTSVTWLPSSTSSANTMTVTDTTQNTKNSTLCVCVCKHRNQTIQESIEKRRRELIVNKTELSFNIRKRTSARDNRKTSRMIGTVAVIILIVYGLLFFCADIWNLLAMCRSNMFHKNNQIEPNV